MLKKLLSFLLIAASFAAEVPFAYATGAAQSSQKGQNLLTYSEQFDNAAWTKSALTVSANAVAAPDGTMTADKLSEQVVTAFPTAYLTSPTTNGDGVYTYSAYFKDNTRQYVHLYAATGDASVPRATFDLTGGTVTFTAGTRYISSSITSLRNGWYRCSLTFTLVGTLSFAEIMLNNVSGDSHAYLGDTSKSVYAWGAQLVAGRKPAAYNRVVASALNTSYTPAGVRQSSQKGQNLLKYSEQFDNAAWQLFNTTVTANTAAAPDGTLTADTAHLDGANGFVGQVSLTAPTPGTLMTWSVYLKSATSTQAFLYSNLLTSVDSALFTLTGSGAVGSLSGTNVVSASIRPVGNGWYRCSLTYRYDSDQVRFYVVGVGTSLYAWGAQLVAGRKPAAYNRVVASALNTSYTPAGVKQSSQKGQNLLLWSEQLEKTIWAKGTGVTVTANTVTSPVDGMLTADSIVYDGSGVAGGLRIENDPGVSAPLPNGQTTFSIWLRVASGTRNMRLRVLGTTTSYITSIVVTSAWQRFSVSGLWTDTNANAIQALIYDEPGTNSAGTIYAFGGQFVQGNKPAAYNRTTATRFNP